MRLSAALEAFVLTFSPYIRNRIALNIVREFTKYRSFRFLEKAYDPNVIRKKKSVILKEQLYDCELSNGILRVDLNDHIGFRIFISKTSFDTTSIEVAKKLRMTKNDIFLDIGANIGSVCVPLCGLLDCECLVVEASNRNATLLLRNLYQNNIRSTAWTRALVSPDYNDQYIELHSRDGNTGANSIKKGWNPSVVDSAPEIVRTAKLDEIVTESELNRIKLVKIDVEGAEEDVLRGGPGFVSRINCPIILEYRIDATRKYLNSDYDGLLEVLTDRFEIYALDRNIKLAKFDPKRSYENIIAIPRSFDKSSLR